MSRRSESSPGIEPPKSAPRPHVGSLKSRVELQDEYETFILLADIKPLPLTSKSGIDQLIDSGCYDGQSPWVLIERSRLSAVPNPLRSPTDRLLFDDRLRQSIAPQSYYQTGPNWLRRSLLWVPRISGKPDRGYFLHQCGSRSSWRDRSMNFLERSSINSINQNANITFLEQSSAVDGCRARRQCEDGQDRWVRHLPLDSPEVVWQHVRKAVTIPPGSCPYEWSSRECATSTNTTRYSMKR